MKFYLILSIVALLAFSHITVAQTPTPEIADTSLQDIAIVIPYPQSPTGAAIIYNPNTCQQIGIACLFFKFHEHCHVINGDQFRANGMFPMEKEREADRCGAATAPPMAICATYQLFLNGFSSYNFQVYGTPSMRAQRLKAYAVQAGNWQCPF